MEGENRIRCRMKYGNMEFEIEGVSDKALSEKINYLYDTFKQAIKTKSIPPKDVSVSTTRTERRGGGRRRPFIKKAILKIKKKEPQWFVDKSPNEVLVKLKTEYGVPGANLEPVRTALMRLFRDGEFTRKEMEGKYVYSVPTLSKT